MAAVEAAAVAAVEAAGVGMEAALAGMAAAEASALEAADAEASALEAAEVVAAEAAEAVEAAGELAWYGHLCGPGAAGVSLHLRLRCLPSRRSNPHRQRSLGEKVTGKSSPHEPNRIVRVQLS
jgi:hypothetical protein